MVASPEIEHKACEKVNVLQNTNEFNTTTAEYETTEVTIDYCNILFSDDTKTFLNTGKVIEQKAKHVQIFNIKRYMSSKLKYF